LVDNRDEELKVPGIITPVGGLVGRGSASRKDSENNGCCTRYKTNERKRSPIFATGDLVKLFWILWPFWRAKGDRPSSTSVLMMRLNPLQVFYRSGDVKFDRVSDVKKSWGKLWSIQHSSTKKVSHAYFATRWEGIGFTACKTIEFALCSDEGQTETGIIAVEPKRKK
jgi:hypothetical protein